METSEIGGAASKAIRFDRTGPGKDRVLLKRQTVEAMLDRFRETIELLSTNGFVVDDEEDEAEAQTSVDSADVDAPISTDFEADEFCSLLKSRVECLDFLEKVKCAQASIPQNMTEEGSSWDIVNENDICGDIELDKEDYVLVSQDDIADGMACFMAAYLLSLKETKDLTPNQIQDALGKTFSVKKRKGRLQKAWEGSKVIYNVASWGATAIGLYQNPAIITAASAAFWSSCRVISKLI